MCEYYIYLLSPNCGMVLGDDDLVDGVGERDDGVCGIILQYCGRMSISTYTENGGKS